MDVRARASKTRTYSGRRRVDDLFHHGLVDVVVVVEGGGTHWVSRGHCSTCRFRHTNPTTQLMKTRATALFGGTAHCTRAN